MASVIAMVHLQTLYSYGTRLKGKAAHIAAGACMVTTTVVDDNCIKDMLFSI